MTKQYEVQLSYEFTKVVFVEADSEDNAIDLAMLDEEEPVNNGLRDSEAIEIEG